MDHSYNTNTFLPMVSTGQHQQPQYASYSAMSNQQQQQQQQQHHAASNDTPTLPPLQPSSNNYSHLPSLYTSAQHAPSPHPHTPVSSAAPAHGQHAYSHHPITSGSMPPPPSTYLPMGSVYATSQPANHSSAMTPSSAAPAGALHTRLPDIRPMPQSNYNSPLSPFPPFTSQHGGMSSQTQYLPSQETEPTHVVGSQGRRGILPSAPGRAAPPTPGSAAASTKSMIPAKDADGKFPCPHCNKTYLHAKHLKRHLLRRMCSSLVSLLLS